MPDADGGWPLLRPGEPREVLVAPGLAVAPGVRDWSGAAPDLMGRVCWLPRAEAEVSARFVQLIPCAALRASAAVRDGDRWLLLRRLPGPSADLPERFSLLAGGHAEGGSGGGTAPLLLRGALDRELREELGIGARGTPGEPFAVLRDGDRGPAARHAAIVWILDVRPDRVEVAPGDEYAPEGTRWARINEVRDVGGRLDPWSAMLLRALSGGGDQGRRRAGPAGRQRHHRDARRQR